MKPVREAMPELIEAVENYRRKGGRGDEGAHRVPPGGRSHRAHQGDWRAAITPAWKKALREAFMKEIKDPSKRTCSSVTGNSSACHRPCQTTAAATAQK
jgi:hypothetical protein